MNSKDQRTVVLASGNAGKLRELARILAPLGVTLRSQQEYRVPEVDETGLSFVENAIIKARAACEHSGLPAIADDSGLEVDYLTGAPGIYSARYSGRGDAANNLKLLAELEGVPRTSAAPASSAFWCICAMPWIQPPWSARPAGKDLSCSSPAATMVSVTTRCSTCLTRAAALRNWPPYSKIASAIAPGPAPCC